MNENYYSKNQEIPLGTCGLKMLIFWHEPSSSILILQQIKLHPLWPFREKLCGLSFAAGAFQRFLLTDRGVLSPRTRDTSLGRREEWTGVSVHWCSSQEMKKALALQLTPCQYRSMSSGGRKADWVADGAVGFSVRDLKRWRAQASPGSMETRNSTMLDFGC